VPPLRAAPFRGQWFAQRFRAAAKGESREQLLAAATHPRASTSLMAGTFSGKLFRNRRRDCSHGGPIARVERYRRGRSPTTLCRTAPINDARSVSGERALRFIQAQRMGATLLTGVSASRIVPFAIIQSGETNLEWLGRWRATDLPRHGDSPDRIGGSCKYLDINSSASQTVCL